jgi:hypothetical protein
LNGLEQGERYALNMSWWDFNTDQRRQSVWVSMPGGLDKKQVRKNAGLPTYLVHGELPETVTAEVPPKLIKDGSAHVIVQCEGGANAVVGEVWVRQVSR